MGRGAWGVFALTATVIISVLAAHGETRIPAGRFGPHSVWLPTEKAVGEIREFCLGSRVQEVPSCVERVMLRHGAGREAAEFTRMTSGEAFMKRFEEVGQVDVAYVEFPFRANENQGCYLVNGEPLWLDVDDPLMVDKSSLGDNFQFQQIQKDFREVTVWPGDRSPDGFLSFRNLEDGGQRFIFDYYLRDGCHACAMVGVAHFAFDFDSRGRFKGSELMDVMRTPTSSSNGAPESPAEADPNSAGREGVRRVTRGETFVIRLEANPSTGYQWHLAKPFDSQVIEQVERHYAQDNTGLMGAGGLETWIFKAVGTGRTRLLFKHVRPWEQEAPPDKEAAFEIVVLDPS